MTEMEVCSVPLHHFSNTKFQSVHILTNMKLPIKIDNKPVIM